MKHPPGTLVRAKSFCKVWKTITLVGGTYQRDRIGLSEVFEPGIVVSSHYDMCYVVLTRLIGWVQLSEIRIEK